MKRRKEDYFVILFAAILLIIVFGIVAVLLTSNTPSNNVIARPTAVPTETQLDLLQPIHYDTDAQERLAKKIINRPTLSPQDLQTKDTTLTTILHGPNSGVVYETATVRVEYVESADMFMAEIKTINIDQAKAEANIFFRKQGLSQDGICNLPLMFYINPDVEGQLRGENITFSPLPNSC